MKCCLFSLKLLGLYEIKSVEHLSKRPSAVGKKVWTCKELTKIIRRYFFICLTLLFSIPPWAYSHRPCCLFFSPFFSHFCAVRIFSANLPISVWLNGFRHHCYSYFESHGPMRLLFIIQQFLFFSLPGWFAKASVPSAILLLLCLPLGSTLHCQK